MAIERRRMDIAAPGFEALRLSSDVPYVGMKEFFAIVRVEAGEFRFWTRGRTWSGRRGSILLQQPGDIHRDLSREGVVTLQLVRFPLQLVEHLTDAVRLDPCLAPEDERAAALQRLQDAVAAGAQGLELECAIAEALAALEGIAETRHAPTRPVRRALRLLRERLSEQLTLDELARHSGLDKYHLCRAFRAEVGLPPHQYLTRLRIMHAKELLAAGTRPKDVAPRVGLYDQSQLNRHFRRIVGMTPGEFARRA